MLSLRRLGRGAVRRALSCSAAPPQLVVGLEVHAQLALRTKLFSAGATSFASPPNTSCSLVDAALPGTLPVLNARAVRLAALLGAALGGTVELLSTFERKHYFYVDMPQGYQITQQSRPIVTGGALSLDSLLERGASRTVRVTRIQLEQDSGKNVHDLHPRRTYVDLNRAGSALVEVVTEPDMRSAAEAAAFVRKLQALVRYLGVSSGNMEDGSLRCDVNVSLAREGVPGLGERVEVKNLNSVRSLVAAVEHEEARQLALLRAGREVPRETRGFDSGAGVTVHQRSKEDMLDYRFFPEPDLPPLRLSRADIEAVRASVPELPDQVVARYTSALGLSAYDANVIVAEPGAPAFFDEMVAGGGEVGRPPKRCANWLANELFGRLAARGLPLSASPAGPEALGGVVDLVEAGEVSGKQGKDLLDMVVEGDARPPAEIAQALGWRMVSDEARLAEACERAVLAHPAEVAKYARLLERGKPVRGVEGFMVGRVLRETGGKGNPKVVAELVRARLAAEANATSSSSSS